MVNLWGGEMMRNDRRYNERPEDDWCANQTQRGMQMRSSGRHVVQLFAGLPSQQYDFLMFIHTKQKRSDMEHGKINVFFRGFSSLNCQVRTRMCNAGGAGQKNLQLSYFYMREKQGALKCSCESSELCRSSGSLFLRGHIKKIRARLIGCEKFRDYLRSVR